MNKAYRSAVAGLEGIPNRGGDLSRPTKPDGYCLLIVELRESQEIRVRPLGSCCCDCIPGWAASDCDLTVGGETTWRGHWYVVSLLDSFQRTLRLLKIHPSHLAEIQSRWLYCVTAKSTGEPTWQAILELVKNLSEIMLASLPSFWKISRSFIEGRFKKVYLAISFLFYWFSNRYMFLFSSQCHTRNVCSFSPLSLFRPLRNLGGVRHNAVPWP